jgi:hypothetical protein
MEETLEDMKGGVTIILLNEFNYMYIGVLFNYNDHFRKTQEHAAEQGRKICSISKNLKRHSFNTKPQCYIVCLFVCFFFTYVNTVLL